MNERELQWWRRVKGIFQDAQDAPSGEVREELLARHCEGDSAIRREVDQLLALRAQSQLVVDRPVVKPGALRNFEVYGEGAAIAGRYRIQRFVGAGGMGEVYAALDSHDGVTKALKFVLSGRESAEVEARFRREVRLARQIEHPNVCRIESLEEHEGRLFCVMEFLTGETLAERLSRGAVPLEEAREIALQVCAGLQAAHASGVIHRDLKPGNILLETGGRAVIIDFGLAAAVDRETTITQAGDVVGTLAYLAPEQLEDGKGTVAADLYALGVILYELVTGRKPHGASSPLKLAVEKARLAERGPALRWTHAIPLAWREAIEGCLHTRPEKRWAGADQVAAILRRDAPSWRYRFTRPGVPPCRGGERR